MRSRQLTEGGRMSYGAETEMVSEMDWRTLEVIAAFEAGGSYPTLRELGEATGLRAVSAVRLHVRRLAECGLVSFRCVGRRRYLAARTIRLTEKGAARMERARALAGTGLYAGLREVRLTDAQYRVVAEAEVPVDVFRQRAEGGCRVLVFRNWQEREFWGERILEGLGMRVEGSTVSSRQ